MQCGIAVRHSKLMLVDMLKGVNVLVHVWRDQVKTATLQYMQPSGTV